MNSAAVNEDVEMSGQFITGCSSPIPRNGIAGSFSFRCQCWCLFLSFAVILALEISILISPRSWSNSLLPVEALWSGSL